MGCCPAHETPCDSRDCPESIASSPQERAICTGEDSLRYNQQKATHLFTAIEGYSEDGKLSPAKFHTLVTELRLNVAGIDEDGAPMKTFYRKFKEMNRYDAHKLALLGVLLAQGDVREKAALLFKTASKGRVRISIEDVKGLLDTMFGISVDFLPLLAVKDTSEKGTFSHKQYIDMTVDLGIQKESARDRLCTLILEFQMEISEEEFVYRFLMDETLRCMTSSRNIRRLLRGELKLSSAPDVFIR